MRKRIIQILVLILPLGLIAAYKSFSENEKDKEKIVTDLVINGLKFAHYNTNKIDDEFSERVYTIFIERLDYTKKFLLQEDITQLEQYKTKIDDEINEQKSNFLILANNLITKRIEEAEVYYSEILANPFDFDLKESIELDDEKNDFAENKETLKE